MNIMKLDARPTTADYPFPDRLAVGHVRKYTGGNSRAVDRRTKFGNPCKIDAKNDRFDVITAYFSVLWANPRKIKDASELSGFDAILCHCHPKPCHGDVLAAFVDAGELPLTAFIHRASLAYARTTDRRWSCHIGVIHTRGHDLYSVVRVALDMAVKRWGD